MLAVLVQLFLASAPQTTQERPQTSAALTPMLLQVGTCRASSKPTPRCSLQQPRWPQGPRKHPTPARRLGEEDSGRPRPHWTLPPRAPATGRPLGLLDVHTQRNRSTLLR